MSRRSIRNEIQDAKDAVDEAVDEAMVGRNPDGVLRIAIDRAKEQIRDEEAIWTGELVESFVAHQKDVQFRYVIRNTSDHAGPVDQGVRGTRGGPQDTEYEYTNKLPPFGPLLLWVRGHWYIFADDYPDAETAAGALQRHIYREGLEGVHFTEVMLKYLRTEAPRELERLAQAHLDANL